VPLFYPNLIRAVIPRNEKYRIFTASKQEFVFLGVLSALSVLIFPLSCIGLRGALHYLVRIPQSAVSDYLDYSAQGHSTLVDFEGIFNISQKKIKGRWPAVSSTSKNTLLLRSPEGKIYSIGLSPSDNIRSLSIQSFKSKPIKILSREITLIEQPLSEVLNLIPKAGKTYILGYIKTYDKPNLDFGLDEYPVIKQGIGRLDFDYATKEDILRQKLSNILASEGRLLLMSQYLPEDKINPCSVEPSLPVDVIPSKVVNIYVKDIYNPAKELKISANDILYKGKLIVSKDTKRDELLIEKKDAEDRLGIAKGELDKLRIQLEQNSQIKQKEDELLNSERPLSLTRRLGEISLKEALAKVDLARSGLEKVEREISATKVYSTVSGKILSILIQHTTATLRILTKESVYSEEG